MPVSSTSLQWRPRLWILCRGWCSRLLTTASKIVRPHPSFNCNQLLTTNTAGIPIPKLVGSKTSVYTGCFTTDYHIQLTKDPLSIPTYAATGTGGSILANRISWFFGLQGPSVNLDSACSSSGMAVDMACQSLRNGDTKMVSEFQS
jgi:hypothetical protein